MVLVFNLEGEREMNDIDRRQLYNFLAGYSIWIIASIISYYFILPDNWKWLAYGPVVFIFLAFIITGLSPISWD